MKKKGDFAECVHIWAKKQRVSTEGERPTSQPRSDLGTTSGKLGGKVTTSYRSNRVLRFRE